MAFLPTPPLPLRIARASNPVCTAPRAPLRAPLRAPVRATASPAAAAAQLPKRVIPSPLPNVYIYDHCPFCVRVRLVLGLKNIKHNLIWLANDDVETPTALVGKKIVPIFQAEGTGAAAIGESLDICKAVDSDERYGPTGMVRPFSGRTDIAKWFDGLQWPMRRLTRIRFAKAPLPEFAFQGGRDAYVRNHPIKQEPSSYEENFARSAEYIAEIQKRLPELAKMIYCKEYCTEGGVSYDDVDLFPKLRSMTLIKGLELPKEVREYVEYQAGVADIPLYGYCAI